MRTREFLCQCSTSSASVSWVPGASSVSQLVMVSHHPLPINCLPTRFLTHVFLFQLLQAFALNSWSVLTTLQLVMVLHWWGSRCRFLFFPYYTLLIYLLLINTNISSLYHSWYRLSRMFLNYIPFYTYKSLNRIS